MHISLDLEKSDLSNDVDSGVVPTVCQSQNLNSYGQNCRNLSQKHRKHFLKFFLDVSYYLCVIPYKIVETVDGSYEKQSLILQQMLCAIVHFFATLDMATNLRQVPYGTVSQNPRMYFNILVHFVHTTVITTFCYSVWTNGIKLCWLVRTVHLCPIVSLWYPKKINIFMTLVILTYVAMALLNPLFNEGFGYSWAKLYDHHVSRGRYMFFFGERIQEHNITGEPAVVVAESLMNYFFSFPEILFALFSYFASSSRWIIIYHADLIVNVMALTLWCATSFFISTLKQQACKQAIINYEALKILTNRINAVVGAVVLTYTVDSILYYATNLESLFTGKNWLAKVIVLQFMLSSVSWLYFASCACLKMDKFREWVREKDNRTALPSKSISIMLLLDEISTNTVALSGNGLFTINYTFVAQALTTVMTYFILVIQFK